MAVVVAAGLMLAGCASLAPAASPAPPTPTAASPPEATLPPTAIPSAIVSPTAPASPTPTEIPASATQAADTQTAVPLDTLEATAIAELPPTPLPHPDIPDAPIRILRPGNLSRVISPFRFVVDVPPGPDGRVQVDLIGEDGRLLARKVFTLATPPGSDRNTAVLDFDFEIRPGIVAEAGRIEVTVLDEFGRIRHLASHDLILLSTGIAAIRFPTTQSDRLLIQQPAERDTLSGGSLIVSGLIRDLGDQPFVIELVAEDGRILATGLAAVDAAPAGEYGLFIGEVVYSISEPTAVRLTVRARGLRIPGNAYISSVVVLLNP